MEPSAPPTEISAVTINKLKLQLVERINSDRWEHGLQPVKHDKELSRLADAHCREMLQFDYVSHWNKEGLKPYMRYSLGGITDDTAENIAGLWHSRFQTSESAVGTEMLRRHEGFMNEQPPFDGHRKAVLGEYFTGVGIGLAFNTSGLRMIEVFAAHYVVVAPLPSKARFGDKLHLRGKIIEKGYELRSVSIFWEPFPAPRTAVELRDTGSYGLPAEHSELRPRLSGDYIYADGGKGSIDVSGQQFDCPLSFDVHKPGVYTVAVWLAKKREKDHAFLTTNICIFVSK